MRFNMRQVQQLNVNQGGDRWDMEIEKEREGELARREKGIKEGNKRRDREKEGRETVKELAEAWQL